MNVPAHMPRLAASAWRCSFAYRPLLYFGQSMAWPLATSQRFTSVPSARVQIATILFRSLPVLRHETGRDSERKASRASAEALPQRYGLPAASTQLCRLSGASIPSKRMRVPWMSMVSPSMTEARPTMSVAPAKGAGKTRRSAMAIWRKVNPIRTVYGEGFRRSSLLTDICRRVA